MAKIKVILAEFQHETNVFCPLKAGMDEFKEFYFRDADEVLPSFKGTGTIVGGMIGALEENQVEIIPVLATQANPSGLVTAEMFDYARDKILGAIRSAGRVDGVCLGLHGAMVSESEPDSEGALLKAVRAEVGPDVPVVASLDLHGNVSREMVRQADAFFPYEGYPHIDCYERGYEAGACLVGMLKKEIRPVMRLRQLPILANFITSTAQPHVDFLERVHQWEKKPGVINVAVMHGFPWADIPDAGVSVVVVTDGDGGLAEQILDDVAGLVWSRRHELIKEFYTPEQAVKEAMASSEGPVILADAADNPGGGGSGDSTFILRALQEAGAQNVGFAVIPDAAAVEKAVAAGVGETVTVSLGGKLAPPEVCGGPLEMTGVVKTISDGRFYNKGPMMKGLLNDIGRTVVLDCGGIEVIVPEWRMQPFDAEVFRRHGMEPAEKHILVLKSAVHFRASYAPLASKILDVDTPEYCSMNFSRVPFKNVRRPIYPLDQVFDYNPHKA
jgi:microcystin degradation protein MlrC